jgi:S-adenosylmethionine/arginine decarboxylase-like enzyme
MMPPGSRWGLSASLDAYECDASKIRCRKSIETYVIELCKVIDMKRFKQPMIYRFGSGHIEGYSVAQFIETSMVSGHFAEESNAAFIDIFSCKDYDVFQAVNFTKKYFGSSNVVWNSTNRGEFLSDAGKF